MASEKGANKIENLMLQKKKKNLKENALQKRKEIGSNYVFILQKKIFQSECTKEIQVRAIRRQHKRYAKKKKKD